MYIKRRNTTQKLLLEHGSFVLSSMCIFCKNALIPTIRFYHLCPQINRYNYFNVFKYNYLILKFYITAVACKKRWQCLRDAYRRAINKKKGKRGKAAKNIKPWKYENEMAFVAPFIIEKRKKDYVELTSEDESSDIADEYHREENSASEQANTETEDNEGPVDIISDATSADEVPQIEEGRSQERNNTKKRKSVKRKAVKITSAVLKAKLREEQKNESYRGHDEIDRFFLSISDTVKKFTPYAQAVVKNKIFSLVSEMELQQLAPSSSSYVFNPASIGSTPMLTSSDSWNEQIQQLLLKNTPKRKEITNKKE